MGKGKGGGPRAFSLFEPTFPTLEPSDTNTDGFPGDVTRSSVGTFIIPPIATLYLPFGIAKLNPLL